jgi:hypothetical protein
MATIGVAWEPSWRIVLDDLAEKELIAPVLKETFLLIVFQLL